jgi:DNA-binding NarL/FixJ family response regulator
VIVAEHHVIDQEDIARLLQEDFEVLAVVNDGCSLVDAVRRLQPDVAVVGLAMPEMSGIEAIRQLKPAELVAVVFLTTLDDPAVAAHALTVGGMGYVLRSSADRDLIPAIRAALKGDHFVSPPLVVLKHLSGAGISRDTLIRVMNLQL